MIEFLKTNYDLNDNEVVSAIDELPLWSAPFGLRLLDKIKYRKNITALDIGSGLGFPLLEIAMRLGNSCKVYGIDPWKAANDRVKTKIRIYGITNVELINGVAEDIPLPNKSLDLIFSNNGLNNVNDLKKVLSECGRISRLGSQLIFTFNADKTMIEFYMVLEEVLCEKNMNKEIDIMKEHIYKKRRPVEDYQLLLEDAGYSIDEILSDEFNLRFVDGTTMFNHFLIRLAFMESWRSIIPEEKRDEIFSLLEEKLNQIAESKRSLVITVPYFLINCEKSRE
jgi:ubiquinone/menaquinone biosynthesis C-methylase UbiE